MRKFRPIAHLFLLSQLALLVFVGEGCAAIPLATLGAVLGSAGSAASAGSEVYNLGKLDFSAMATFEQARNAAVDAANDLHLEIYHCALVDKRDDELLIQVEDNLKKKIDIRIDRRTQTLCQCRVDVGFFGSEPTAKLIMNRMRRHLPDEGGDAWPREVP